jgi:AhpC/TSA family
MITMFMGYYRICFLVLVFAIYGWRCKNGPGLTQVIVNIKGAAGKKIFLYKEAFINEQRTIIDSATVIDLNHPVRFAIDEAEERAFSIRVEGSANSYYFISDVPNINVEANNINGSYTVLSSPASKSLKVFNDNQTLVSKELRKLNKEIESLSADGKGESDSLQNLFNNQYKIYMTNYKAYADTVKSPAAFMLVYENIDFGKQHNELKIFADKAAKRFPGYQPVAELQKEVYDLADIFEIEFEVGDILPNIELQSSTGKQFSTRSFNGKYYFIDFWASWYPKSYTINYYKKKLWESYKDKGLEIVSVALEDDKEIWQAFIHKDSLVWTQLVDEKMWRGTAARTLKFDSIPFNFLVDPGGRVLEKAIKPDSLITVIGRYIK